MASVQTGGQLQLMRLKNATDREQELWLEPLGDRVVLAPDFLYEIAVTDALEEIELSADGFVVHGWVKSVSRVEPDGRRCVVWDFPDPA